MWDCEVRMLETPGFGDYIDNTGSISVIKKYIEKSHQNWCLLNCNDVTDEVTNFFPITLSHFKFVLHTILGA